MPPAIIDRRSHPIVKELKDIRDGINTDLIFCEGIRLAGEILKSSLPVRSVVCTKKTFEQCTALLRSFPKHCPVVLLNDDVMSFVSDLDSPPGLIVTADRPPFSTKPVTNESRILVTHRFQSPSNLGNLLRTAEAAGVDEVWVTEGSCDPYGPKSLRASAGSAFRVAIRHGVEFQTAISELRSKNVRVFGASGHGGVSFDEIDWTPPFALVMGSEAAGFTDTEREVVTDFISIPMGGKVESLNVGNAAAVLLFSARLLSKRR